MPSGAEPALREPEAPSAVAPQRAVPRSPTTLTLTPTTIPCRSPTRPATPHPPAGAAAACLLALWAIGAVVFGLHHPPSADGADPRTFQPVIYTLGLLLPVVDFQQEDTFTPQGAQSWLSFVLIAAGWILTTTVAASIVRALRREGE